MTEAPRDNLMHRTFVFNFHGDRTIFRCALPRTSVNFCRTFAARSPVDPPPTPHNPRVCFVGHDRTVQNPGDNLAAGR